MLGKHSLNDFNELGSKNFSVFEIILHPEWSNVGEKFHADIAIVVLKEKVEFTSLIKPICLPEQDNDEVDVVGTGRIVGWGRRHQGEFHAMKPEELEIPAIKSSKCYTKYPDLARYASENSPFCGGYENKGKGACTGDSGGGFFIFDSSINLWVVRGIVSSSVTKNINGLCDVNKFHLYTNVARFVNWIKIVVGIPLELTTVIFKCKKG
jgi:secreted trypsin-like serine protease